jgi:transcriptional regulator with XRE-family HTH domain
MNESTSATSLTPSSSTPAASVATFGAWLKQQRKALDITQDDLAERIGCSIQAIRKIESGERRPSRQVAELLAETLRVPPDERATFVQFARSGERAATLVQDAESDSAPTPWRKLRRRLTNLPLFLTPIIGREREVAEVSRLLLQHDRVRLLTLTGAPGIGKTRLAVEVASSPELVERFEDGLFFVGLAPITDPGLLPSAIGAAVGLKGDDNASIIEEALKEHLAEKRALLVLDNFEQLVEARVPQGSRSEAAGSDSLGAGMVSRLLGACPWLKALVTSREALRVRGERRFPVPPLEVSGFSFQGPGTSNQPGTRNLKPGTIFAVCPWMP